MAIPNSPKDLEAGEGKVLENEHPAVEGCLIKKEGVHSVGPQEYVKAKKKQSWKRIIILIVAAGAALLFFSLLLARQLNDERQRKQDLAFYKSLLSKAYSQH